MTYNILLADDHQLFSDGLVRLIAGEEDLHILHVACNGKQIIQYLNDHQDVQVDLLITDISMPDVDGITLNSHIKNVRPETRTLVVSMHTDTHMIDTLIKNGVDGFLSKNAGSSELLQAIRIILGGSKYFSESVKRAYMDNVFNKEKDSPEKLTERELEVLKLIAQEFTTQEIADRLFLSKHTVESYRKTLITKLKVRNMAGLTKYAIKLGLAE